MRARAPARDRRAAAGHAAERGRPADPARRAVYLAVLVERAKKCLDFTATLFLIHAMLCVAYAGWPRSFEWWAVNLVSLILMAVLAEWLCLRRELREIPLTGMRSGRNERGMRSSSSMGRLSTA